MQPQPSPLPQPARRPLFRPARLAGVAGTLLLVALLPLALSGCSKKEGEKEKGAAGDSGGKKGGSGTEFVTPPEELAGAPIPQPGQPTLLKAVKKPAYDGGTIKVGIMHSLTGTMAISEISLKDAELMAIKEINDAGGVTVKGKKYKVEAVVEDPASNFETGFPEKATKLLLNDKVTAVFGCWTSASRKSVLKIFEDNNGMLFYPVQYEGNECSKNVVYTGAAPNQQILPAIEWLWKQGYRKFYLLGSDYIFPRTANYIIKKQLEKVHATKAVEEKYTPLGHRDYASIVADIKAKEPDVIFSTINGDSNLNFYNELASNGITAKGAPWSPKKGCPVLAVSVAEDELRGLDKKIFPKFEGHLAAWNYFMSLDTPANKEFVKRFQDFTNDKTRVTDDPIEAAYFQVYMWKYAVEKAGDTAVDPVREAIKDLVIDAPSGKVKVDGKNFHTWRPFYVGEIRGDGQFRILHDSGANRIRPQPYPRVAYRLDCDWSKGGTFKVQ